MSKLYYLLTHAIKVHRTKWSWFHHSQKYIQLGLSTGNLYLVQQLYCHYLQYSCECWVWQIKMALLHQLGWTHAQYCSCSSGYTKLQTLLKSRKLSAIDRTPKSPLHTSPQKHTHTHYLQRATNTFLRPPQINHLTSHRVRTTNPPVPAVLPEPPASTVVWHRQIFGCNCSLLPLAKP